MHRKGTIPALQVGYMESGVLGAGRGRYEIRRPCVRCGVLFLAKTTGKYCIVCKDIVLDEHRVSSSKEQNRKLRERRRLTNAESAG